jgi:hypothetical protein
LTKLTQELASIRETVWWATLAVVLALTIPFWVMLLIWLPRLESSCKNYNADLIISEYSLVDGYDYKFLDEVTVKGKSEPVKIYTIEK